jgi:hypothetical protein
VARATHLQTSFNGGEFSPLLEGRVDLQRYASSCHTMKNFLPTVSGPTEKRPGTHFAGVARSPTSKLIPFQFSVEQAYVLEFTGGLEFANNGWIRVYKDGAPVVEQPFTVTAIGIGNPTTFTTSVAHQFWPFSHPDPEDNVDSVFIDGVGGTLGDRINNRIFEITNTGATDGTSTTFSIDFDSTGLSASAVFGTVSRVYEIATSYTEEDVAGLVAAQSADVLYLATPTHHPMKLLRFGHDDWTLTPVLGFSLAETKTLSDVTRHGSVPVVTTVQPHGFAVGDMVWFSRVQGMRGLNGAICRVGSVTEFTFTITDTAASTLDSTAYHFFGGGGKVASTGFVNRIPEWRNPPFAPENGNQGSEVICTRHLKSDTNVILFSSGGIFKTVTAGLLSGKQFSYLKIRELVEAVHTKWEPVSNFNGTGTDDIIGGAIAVGGLVQWEGNVYELTNLNAQTKTGNTPPTHDGEDEEQLDHKFTWKFAHPGSGFVEIHAIDPVDGFWAFGRVRRRLPKSVTVDADTTLFRENCTSTAANPVVVTVAAGHGFVVGDRVFLCNFSTATKLNGLVAYVQAVTGTTITLYHDAALTNLVDGTTQGAGTLGKVVRWHPVLGTTTPNQATPRWSLAGWCGGRSPWHQFPGIGNSPLVSAIDTGSSFGYPRAVAFFEDRLWWAGNAALPQTVWASATGDYENYDTNDPVTGALLFSINDQNMNAIDWLHARRGLVIGTRGGEFVAAGINPDEPVSSENPLRPQRATAYGTQIGVSPVQIGTSVLFAQRTGRSIREFAYDEQNSSEFKAPDVSLLANHLFNSPNGVLQLAWQSEPHSLLWVVTGDNDLRACVFDRTQDVVGWSQHQLGGDLSGAAPAVTSVAVIPHPDGDQDQLWLVVTRGVGTYIEYMEKPFRRDPTIADPVDDLAVNAWCVDAGLRYSGAPATLIQGIDHLEGETVQALADGVYRGTFVVADGSITLTAPASEVVVGLAYGDDAVLETSRIEAGGGDGPAQGKFKNVRSIVPRLYETGTGLYYGRDADTMDELVMRTDNDPAGAAVTLWDGDTRELTLPGDNNQLGRVRLEHRRPLPCTIVSLVVQLQVEDD